MKRSTRASRLVVLALLALVGGAWAQDQPDLEQLIEEAKQAQQEARAYQEEREQRFQQQWKEMAKDYAPLEAEVEQKLQAVEALEARLEASNDEVRSARQSLSDRLGPYADLYGAVRQQAAELERDLATSLTNAARPQRVAGVGALARGEQLADLSQLNGLLVTLLEELKAQGETASFTTAVLRPEGDRETVEATRIGPFVAVHAGRYLEYEAEQQRFRALGRQPSGRYRQAARNLELAEPGEQITTAIDPTRGSILALLVQTPSLEERLHQGGLVGYLIIGLAVLGVLLAFVRILHLRWTLLAVKRQLRRPEQPRDNNPLGRVLRALQQGNDDSDTELMEHQLDEAILRETPALNRGLPLLKLLAAIAPLMGLLGTVVGMIITFQAISLFGAGDPKLMAGGISQALVTTVLGLITAIPLLLLHSLAAGTSRQVEQILEGQAAALMAARLQRQA